MSSIDKVRLLDSVEKPDGLEIEVVESLLDLMTRPVVLNKSAQHWFGTAFVQGRRLQFTTSMPIQDYLNTTEFVRAKKGATVEELRERSNRTKIPSHERDIREYLADTAFEGEKFIFPNFMVNFGANWIEGNPKAKLTLLVSNAETLSWAAVFEPPTGVRLAITDGAHRTSSLQELIANHKNRTGVGALLANSVGVTVVMEAEQDDAHQDFADCGKAKAIADSVIATWDKRNVVARFARDLVQGNAVMSKVVDATSPSVNLSSNSPGLWSMSAVRGAILSALPADFANLSPEDKTALLEQHAEPLDQFLTDVFDHVPLLQDWIAKKRLPGVVRKDRGGCVLARGAGFAILMRAYRAGVTAKQLASVDWFVLKLGAPEQPAGDVYPYLKANAHPAWFQLVAINPGNDSWRIKGTMDNIDAAFAELAAAQRKAA